MKRLLLAAGTALLIHVLFLSLKIGDWQRPSYMMQPSQKLTMSLSYRQPEKMSQKQASRELPEDQVRKTGAKPKAVNSPGLQSKTMPEIKKILTPTPEEHFAKEETAEKKETHQVKDVSAERVARRSKNENLDDKSSVVRMATPLYHLNPPPKYPQIAKKRGYQGTVLLNVLVETDGTVGDLEIFQTSGYSILDRAARNGVGKWIFSPGQKGTKAVEMWVRVPVRFQLQ